MRHLSKVKTENREEFFLHNKKENKNQEQKKCVQVLLVTVKINNIFITNYT